MSSVFIKIRKICTIAIIKKQHFDKKETRSLLYFSPEWLKRLFLMQYESHHCIQIEIVIQFL